jgi:predicted enzyme related to lactoylglutathione lyase
MCDKPPRIPGPPSWLHYVRVKDVDATAKVIPMLGGKVLNGPMEVPGGSRIVQALDPQGAAFALHAVPNT